MSACRNKELICGKFFRIIVREYDYRRTQNRENRKGEDELRKGFRAVAEIFVNRRAFQGKRRFTEPAEFVRKRDYPRAERAYKHVE